MCNFFQKTTNFLAKFPYKFEIYSYIWSVDTHFFTKLLKFTYLCISFSTKKKDQGHQWWHLRCFIASKKVAIYAFLVCKIFGPKIRSCEIFDKFQVCFIHLRRSCDTWKFDNIDGNDNHCPGTLIFIPQLLFAFTLNMLIILYWRWFTTRSVVILRQAWK